METPSSTRRVTRSQALAALSNNSNSNIPVSKKIDSDSEKGLTKSRQRNGKQQDQSALIDITNGSPIVGVATGGLETPSSAIAKQRGNRPKNTPGSGESLLRGQVKTLLQKVEEEAELSKLSSEGRTFLHIQGLVNSPMGLLATTPANTPQIPNLSEDGIMNDTTGLAPLPIVEEQLISQEVSNIFGQNQESIESQKSLITRSLLLDFSDKSEICDSSECSSVLTYQEALAGESESKEKSSTEDDDASVWSIQVNASTIDEDEEEIIEEEEENEDGGLVDELCEGISKISVNEKVPKFSGKHTIFVYNSDDEFVDEEEFTQNEDDDTASSPNILHLKGLPTPKGKHLRFLVEEEEQDDE
ncbi:Chalcone-flavanone isomerase family protein [Quillaja saponaria]|uniref:Chalcone-flavanone isomerase family protein n=1 Tax=Quillaja saponaria TaxID=32244 RepID=A0AAD7L7N0_QUISA|nr:Chalcone-flavanone isomerase family protein [Quillaja saponaria]